MNKIEIIYLKRLGKLFKQLRNKRGYSLEYIVEETGIKDLKKIENGKNTDFKSIFILCNFYEVDVRDVFTRYKKI
jgi:transcriptional regulator with XRE-family HTH domain